MKVKELRAILAQAEDLYRSAGEMRAVTAVRRFSETLAAYEVKSVAEYVKLAAKARS